MNISCSMTRDEATVVRFAAISYIFCFINAISATLAAIGNSLVLLAICRTPALRSPPYILLSGLATSDLAVGLIVQPLWISEKVTVMHRNCLMFLKLKNKWHLFFELLTAVTFTTVCAISFDRYLAVKLHLRYNEFVTTKRLYLVLGVTWVSSSIFAMWKTFHPSSSEVFEITFGLLSLLVTLWCNFKVFQTVQYHRNRIQVQARVLQSSWEIPNIARQNKSARTIKYIVSLFLISYLPYFLFLMIAQAKAKERTAAYILVQDFLITFQCFNSCLNPMLYCWRIEDMRQVVKTILKKPFKRR